MAETVLAEGAVAFFLIICFGIYLALGMVFTINAEDDWVVIIWPLYLIWRIYEDIKDWWNYTPPPPDGW